MSVSGVRSGAVSCERVCVSCEWASRRSSVVRREAFFFALRFVRDSEVFVSCFEFEFLFRTCRRISNSNFSFRCSIRFLEFQFSIRISNSSSLIFRVEFVVEIFDVLLYSTSRISNFDSSFECKFLDFSCRIYRRNFRFVALFDFSNFALSLLSNSTSRSSSFRFEFSSQVPWISNSSWSLRLLELQFESFVDLVKFSKSHSSFEFLIELFNFRRNLIIINAIVSWRPQLFSHDRSRFALVVTRALRALFVRKILVKRQFTFSLYFGIIEL